jgi:hypothetical protein
MADPIVIEVDEQGNIGTLPEPVQAFVNKAINEAFKRGAQKVEREMSSRAIDPAERERLLQAQADANLLREEIATRDKNFEEAARLREERFQRELDQREQTLKSKETEIGRRDARLRGMLGAEIRAAAVAAGAREESLPELQKLLGADLDLDEHLEPFVKGEGNAPKLDKDGKPVSIEGLVREYLASHPHHLRGGQSQSGRAQGGASIGRSVAAPSPADEAVERLAADPSLRNLTAAVRNVRLRATGTR